MRIIKVPSLKTPEDLERTFASFGYEISAGTSTSTLSQPYGNWTRPIGNRFAILPMEGWDAEADGRPSELVARRWLNFARGGAKFLWGCEAAAVEHTVKANPRQLVIDATTIDSIAALYRRLRQTHADTFGTDSDLVVGLQLTHSGRWCRPDGIVEPRIAYRHPELDARVNATDANVIDDAEIERLVEVFVDRATLAAQAGFDFVDIKHCHGYLAHELLSARRRSGRYGGSFENRTRFLRQVAEGVRQRAPDIEIGVRLSAYDLVPFRKGANDTGEPVHTPQEFRFGANPDGTDIDLSEPTAFLELLAALDIHLVCITGGSPYYNPHIQRPARYPPSDGYQPPEDPLVGVARMITVTRELKRRFPNLTLVSSGYTYLQEWLPAVAAAEVAQGGTDLVGLGRMALSYPDLPNDILKGHTVARKKLCRTFSDCTTAPRQGWVSGCYPLDDFYAGREEAGLLKAFKQDTKAGAA